MRAIWLECSCIGCGEQLQCVYSTCKKLLRTCAGPWFGALRTYAGGYHLQAVPFSSPALPGDCIQWVSQKFAQPIGFL